MKATTEDDIERYHLQLLQQLGYIWGNQTVPAADPSPPDRAKDATGTYHWQPSLNRASDQEVILKDRLKTAIARLNPQIPSECYDQALRDVLTINRGDLLSNNEQLHQ